MFMNLIDATMSNIWNLYKISADLKIFLLHVQRSVAQALFKVNEHTEDLQSSFSFTRYAGHPSFFQNLALNKTRKDLIILHYKIILS